MDTASGRWFVEFWAMQIGGETMRAAAALSTSAAILLGQAVTIAQAQAPAVPKFKGTYAFLSTH